MGKCPRIYKRRERGRVVVAVACRAPFPAANSKAGHRVDWRRPAFAVYSELRFPQPLGGPLPRESASSAARREEGALSASDSRGDLEWEIDGLVP